VVARFRRGKMVKGQALNFYPSHPTFRIKTHAGEHVLVKMQELKAVFFVRDLEGNPAHTRRRDFPAIRPPGASEDKTAVLFKDGEMLLGYVDDRAPGQQGFFVKPADVGGNNMQVYVIADATNYVTVGSQAVTLAKFAPEKKRPTKDL
jgi:hypothetical protein